MSPWWGPAPSGLTCAYYLAKLGHQVDVYEAEAVAGGVLYWGIPEYRLPNEVLAQEIAAIEAGRRHHPHQFRIGSRSGCVMTVNELMERSDAVYMAIGTQKPMRMDVPGEDLKGVESGLSFLRRVGLDQDKSVPSRLVVIGGGSTAMDVARTALRLGAEEVTVAYRRTVDEMPAGAEEVAEAGRRASASWSWPPPWRCWGENGAVTGIRLIRRELSGFGKDGRMSSRSIPGSQFDIPCDGGGGWWPP